jgi:hypothetical protein
MLLAKLTSLWQCEMSPTLTSPIPSLRIWASFSALALYHCPNDANSIQQGRRCPCKQAGPGLTDERLELVVLQYIFKYHKSFNKAPEKTHQWQVFITGKQLKSGAKGHENAGFCKFDGLK